MLVIGSPFLWWMRVAELRAVLAPVVAGTGPSAHPDIAAARRFVRGLDGAVADAAVPVPGPLAGVRRVPRAFVGRIARLLLHRCRGHAAEMERSVAAAASFRAQGVDYGLRIVAQEQVGLAYAGWDRLLTGSPCPPGGWAAGRPGWTRAWSPPSPSCPGATGSPTGSPRGSASAQPVTSWRSPARPTRRPRCWRPGSSTAARPGRVRTGRRSTGSSTPKRSSTGSGAARPPACTASSTR